MRLSAKIAAIEIDGDFVRVVVVKTGATKPSVVEARAERARYAAPEERRDALVLAVRTAVAAIKSKPAVYVLSVNCWTAVARTLTIPFKGAARVASAVPFELEPFLAFPIDDLIVDHTTIREADGNTDVLAVGVRRVPLEEQLDTLQSAGVTIEGINLDAAGLATLWFANHRSPTGLRAQLHVRGADSILVITYNRSLALFRPLLLTAKKIDADPQAASREIQNSIRSFLAGWKAENNFADLCVTGVVLDPAVRDAFAEGLSIPVVFESLTESLKGVDRVRNASGVDGEEASAGASSNWDAIIGVATAAAGAGVGLEFRKGSLIPAGSLRGVLTHGIFSVALLVLVLLGYIGYCVIDYRRNMEELAFTGNQIWDLYAKTFPKSDGVKSGRPSSDEGGMTTIGLFKQEHDRAAETGSDISIETLSRTPLVDILKELCDRLPSDKILVNDLRVRKERGDTQSINISGVVKDTQAFSQIFDNLKKSPLLHIQDEPILSSNKDGTTFIINAKL